MPRISQNTAESALSATGLYCSRLEGGGGNWLDESLVAMAVNQGQWPGKAELLLLVPVAQARGELKRVGTCDIKGYQ